MFKVKLAIILGEKKAVPNNASAVRPAKSFFYTVEPRITTMRDRAMQDFFLQTLDPVLETLADYNSYGFRKHRSCGDAIARCFSILAKKDGPR